jgi:CDP-diacylglycerol--glycerol-3-phosphate 3-phosphatidyltransferase
MKTRSGNIAANLILKFPRAEGIYLWIRLIPAWVPANLISVVRAFLIIPIYFACRSSATGWAIGLYLTAWFTDIIDGWHARFRKQQSSMGKFLDPGADKVLIVGLLVLIGPGRLSPHIIYTITGLEALLILVTIIIGPLSKICFRVRRKLGANIFGKMKMLLEGLSLAVLLVGLGSRNLQAVAEGIMWCAALLGFISVYFYLTTKDG